MVKVQSVAPVHFRIIRCHQIEKRHHIWLLLSKVFADLEKVISLKWRCPPWEAFHWWRGEHSAEPSVRPIVECSVGVSLGQEGIILRIKWQTQDFWSQQKQAHIDYQAHPDQVQGKLWCSLSLQESTWYEEALWEESISSHHVLGPLDDLLFLQQLQLPAVPEETKILLVWTGATRSQSWSPSGSWGDPASIIIDSPLGCLEAQTVCRGSAPRVPQAKAPAGPYISELFTTCLTNLSISFHWIDQTGQINSVPRTPLFLLETTFSSSSQRNCNKLHL